MIKCGKGAILNVRDLDLVEAALEDAIDRVVGEIEGQRGRARATKINRGRHERQLQRYRKLWRQIQDAMVAVEKKGGAA